MSFARIPQSWSELKICDEADLLSLPPSLPSHFEFLIEQKEHFNVIYNQIIFKSVWLL